MLIYVLTGWICGVDPIIGCIHTPLLLDQNYYPTEVSCLQRIDFFKHNTKYVLSSDLTCERREIEIPQS